MHRPSDTNLGRLSDALHHEFVPSSGTVASGPPVAWAGVPDRVSLIELMSPSYRRGKICVFGSTETDNPAADLLIGLEVHSYLDHARIPPRSGVTSAVFVRGGRLLPLFVDSEIMLLADGTTLVQGDHVLILGFAEDGSRRARFGKLVGRRADELALARNSSGGEEVIRCSECDAIFRVIR